MKKNIIGLAVMVLTLLGSEGLKAQNPDCFGFEVINENYGKNIQTNKKVTLVNNLSEAIAFNVGFKDEEGIEEGSIDVAAHGQQILPYCVSSLSGEDNAHIADINGYLLEKDFYKPGSDFDKTKIKPLNLTDTFKSLQNKKSFNLVITVNAADKDPVVEIK